MAEEIHEEVETMQFRDPNQPNLHVVYWTRAALDKKDGANLLFWNHGVGEHSGRHKDVAARLLRMVPELDAVMTYDIRGHGKSQGAPGAISGLSVLLSDVYAHVLPRTALRYGVDANVVVGGHSMGGLIAAGVAGQPDCLQTEQCGAIVGVILSAPAFRPIAQGAVNKLLAPVVGLLARLPMLRSVARPSGITVSQLCQNETQQKAYTDDPVVHNRISVGVGADLLVYADDLTNRIENGDECVLVSGVPVLVIHSPDDAVCDIAASRRFVDVLAKQDKANVKLVEVAGALHEMHNETDDQGAALFFDSCAQLLQQAFTAV